MPEMMTVEEMQKFLRISRWKAYELTHEPGFPVVRLGRAVRVPKSALMEWMERQTVASQKAE